MRRSLPAAAFGALLACASRRTAAPPTATAPRPPARPAGEIARVYVRTEGYGDGARGCVEVDGGDGVTRRVRRGFREETRDGVTRRAAVRFAADPQWVFRDASGWHFLTESNRWRSADFLGDAEQVTLAERGRIGRGPGRPVVVLDGVVEGLRVPGVVADAAFRDDREGLAVVEPGAVLATADGGAGWRHVPLDGMATGVIATPEALYVEAEGALWRYDGAGFAAGQLERPGACEGADAEGEGDADDASRPPVSPSAARWLDDGHARVLSTTTGVVYDLAGDRAEEALALPCRDARFLDGSASLAVCGDRGGAMTLRRREGEAWRDLATMRSCGIGRCAASPDGARVACEGRCDRRAECDGVATVCEVSAGGHAAERRLGDGRRGFWPAGYDGDALVLVDDRRFLLHKEFVRGSEPPRRLCPNVRSNTLRWAPPRERVWPRLGRDGHLRLELEMGRAGRSALLDAEPGVRCAEVAGPEGEPDAGMRWCGPDGRAVAYAGAAALWFRSGTAGAWRLLGDGDDRDVDLGRLVEGSGDALDCNEVGLWSRYDSDFVLGWGAMRPMRRAEVGVREHGGHMPEHVEPWPCEVRSEPLPPTPPAAPPEGRATNGVVVGSSALWVPAPRPEGDRPGTAWSRFDRRGFALGAQEQATLPLRAGPYAWVTTSDFQGERFSLWRLATNAPAVRREESPRVTYAAHDVLFTAAGPVFALLWNAAGGLYDHTLLHLVRTEGARRDEGDVALSHAAIDPIVLYLRRGAAGVARYLPDGSLVGAPPRQAPRVVAEAGPVAACGAGAEDAATGVFRVRPPGAGSWVDVHLDFAFEGARLCLRGSRDPYYVARFEGGSLVVHREHEGRLERLTCRRRGQ